MQLKIGEKVIASNLDPAIIENKTKMRYVSKRGNWYRFKNSIATLDIETYWDIESDLGLKKGDLVDIKWLETQIGL